MKLSGAIRRAALNRRRRVRAPDRRRPHTPPAVRCSSYRGRRDGVRSGSCPRCSDRHPGTRPLRPGAQRPPPGPVARGRFAAGFIAGEEQPSAPVGWPEVDLSRCVHLGPRQAGGRILSRRAFDDARIEDALARVAEESVGWLPSLPRHFDNAALLSRAQLARRNVRVRNAASLRPAQGRLHVVEIGRAELCRAEGRSEGRAKTRRDQGPI